MNKLKENKISILLITLFLAFIFFSISSKVNKIIKEAQVQDESTFVLDEIANCSDLRNVYTIKAQSTYSSDWETSSWWRKINIMHQDKIKEQLSPADTLTAVRSYSPKGDITETFDFSHSSKQIFSILKLINQETKEELRVNILPSPITSRVSYFIGQVSAQDSSRVAIFLANANQITFKTMDKESTVIKLNEFNKIYSKFKPNSNEIFINDCEELL